MHNASECWTTVSRTAADAPPPQARPARRRIGDAVHENTPMGANQLITNHRT